MIKKDKIVGLLGFVASGFLLFTSCFPVASLPVSEHPHATIGNIEETLRSTIAFVRPRAEVDALGPVVSDIPMTRSGWTSAYCAGFHIAPHYIVSAAHCFQTVIHFVAPDGTTMTLSSDSVLDGTHVWFLYYGETDLLSGDMTIEIPHFGEVVYHDRANDTVIIHTEDTATNFVRLAERNPDISERVYAIGHPNSMDWSIADGMISRIFERDGRIIGLQTTVPTIGGCSGGPLLSASGEVLGMADAYMEGYPHLSLYVATESIRRAYTMALISAAVEAFTTDPNN